MLEVVRAGLFAGVAMAIAVGSPAYSQTEQTPITSAEAAELRAQIAAMRAELDALKAERAKAAAEPATAPKVAAAPPAGVIPSWKGAPQLEDKASGWSFKPRGRIHFDAGSVGVPGAYSANRNLGFNVRARRLRLGAEGTMPGGFGYKIEADFANNAVNFGDAFVSWSEKDSPISVRLGNFETLNGLEQISSSNNNTFTERTQFNDAFLNSRRLGAAVAYQGKEFRLEGGLFAGHSIDGSFNNDGWISAVRGVFAPQAFGGQLHIGASWQHREFQSNDGGTVTTSNNAPSANQLARYRARPFTQLTDVRFVDTGQFAAKSDDVFGFELAGIFDSLYFGGEAQWTKTRSYSAGDLATGLDIFAGGNSAVVPTDDPTFFGVYGEVGYFLTGETRGYKEGIWGRTKVLKPLGKAGGTGAFQIAARVDYLDLDSDRLKNGLTNNFTTGTTSLAALNTRLGRGGTQTGYLLALNWYPIDYIRIMLNYARVEVRGGPLAAQIKPLSVLPVDQRKYGTDLFAARFQLEF
jgi:phosphate-selective porin OprO and OprP